MWPYHPDLLATPVPRYTSFPTAAEFGEGVGPKHFLSALEKVEGAVSLYLHIPFCEKICHYCGCNTGAAGRKQRLASYLDSLHAEIALVGQHMPSAARVTRIAFGGGSPNAISPVDFVRLMASLTMHMKLDDPELSIELDPRTMTRDWAEVLNHVGVNRASLGVQTFAPELQQAIGRIQPLETIERCTEWLREAGVGSLNFDLMYGLPGQSEDDLEETLATACRLGADRLALFGYAHVPHLIPRQRCIDGSALPDQETRFAMAWQGHERLTGAGYVAVGFDHFALPHDPMAQAVAEGRLHRNFQGFTDDEAPVLIGLGASSISSFPELLIQNEKNAGRYRMALSQAHLTCNRGIWRSAADQARGRIIEQLLCQGTAEIGEVLDAEINALLAPFVMRDLVELAGGRCTITPHGLPYARSIAAQFDPYRRDSARRFSSSV
jgi:oxygen-independent coproporphyrinogen-3 oxidase